MVCFVMKFLFLSLITFFLINISASVQILDVKNDSNNYKWTTVNDTVMGGRSSSRLETSPSSTSVFKGYLSLANNGGFASVRHNVRNKNLSNESGFYLKYKGDGRTYQFRVRSKRASWADYYQEFETFKDKEMTIFLPFQDFKPSWRGLTIRMLPTLKGSDITEVGLFLGDKKQGNFKLEISEIKATTNELYQNYLASSELTETKINRNFNNPNELELRFKTTAGFNYLIENSLNLKDWKIYDQIEGSGNNVKFIIENNFNKNDFYRIRAVIN